MGRGLGGGDTRLLFGRGFRLIDGEYVIGEFGLAGWVVRIGGSRGRALKGRVGLVMPEDSVSELARLACGFICASRYYLHTGSMYGSLSRGSHE